MPTRRDFVSCASHLALAAALTPRALHAAWARRPMGRVVAAEPFARLEQIADGVWAVVSLPFSGDRTTLSNGGLIAGRNGVIAIEGFMTPEGARWLAGKSRELTGKWPTHVAVTHYHADHSHGITGYANDTGHPALHVTARTRDDVLTKGQPADDARAAALREAETVGESGEERIDLGGRIARIVPRRGHTASDISIEVDDPKVVFGGDLLWNGMFPNYVDASPTALAASVTALCGDASAIYVPGHGGVARDVDVQRYRALLTEVERAARDAQRRGMTAADAAAAYTIPASLGEWVIFSKPFIQRAFEAWYREL